MKLKTKILSAVCAGALALSMPAMAFALPTFSSPEKVPAAGVEATYGCKDAADVQFKAANEYDVYALQEEYGFENDDILASWSMDVTEKYGKTAQVKMYITIANNVMKGQDVALLEYSEDGSMMVQGYYTVNNSGVFAVTLDSFSTFVAVPAWLIDEQPAPEPPVTPGDNPADGSGVNPDQAGADKTGVSPQTGIAA